MRLSPYFLPAGTLKAWKHHANPALNCHSLSIIPMQRGSRNLVQVLWSRGHISAPTSQLFKLISASFLIPVNLLQIMSQTLDKSLIEKKNLPFCLFLRPHLLHTEVPRLGVESELQLPAYTTATAMPHLQPTSQLMATPDP